MIKPLLIAVVIGLVSCTAVAILVGRIFKQSWYMSFALGVTALFGFPGTLIAPPRWRRRWPKTTRKRS